MKNSLIQILRLLVLFMYVVGGIGGFAFACYYHHYFIALGVAVTAFLAFFSAKEVFNALIED